MSIDMHYPTGYELHIKSTENDGDYPKTYILKGLSEEEVRFYLDVAKQFESKWCHSNDSWGLGNTDENTSDELVNMMREVLARHPDVDHKFRELPDVDDGEGVERAGDQIREWVTDTMLGWSVSEISNFVRCYDGFEVFFIEEPITIPRVTAQFK